MYFSFLFGEYEYELGFIGLVAFSFVGADVPDGPFSFRKDLLSGKGSLRAVEDVGPYD